MAQKIPGELSQPSEPDDVNKQILAELQKIEVSTRDSFKRAQGGIFEIVSSGLLIVAGVGLILAASRYDMDGVLCMSLPLGLALIGIGIYFARNIWP